VASNTETQNRLSAKVPRSEMIGGYQRKRVGYERTSTFGHFADVDRAYRTGFTHFQTTTAKANGGSGLTTTETLGRL